MYNYTLFLAFANQSKFSEDTPGLEEENDFLWYTFNTYIISVALNKNNIFGALSDNTDPKALATNGTKLNYDLGGCKNNSSNHICDAWWYNNETNSAYGLDNFGEMNHAYGDLLKTLLGEYTTGGLIFDSARHCDSLHNFNKSLKLGIDVNGPNTTCISKLKIVSWDMDCVDLNDAGYRCEFAEKDIAPQNNFLSDSGGGSSLYSSAGETIYSVPNAYLGPLLTQTTYKLRRD